MIPEPIQVEISAISDKLKTEAAICYIKERFAKRLAHNLNLIYVSAPIAVLDGTGINDDLNGIEKPVSFSIKGMNGQKALIVQSLAKWKRLRLKEFSIEAGKGLLTDMRAIRPDEDLSPIHSMYVDQWDWEKHILSEQRSLKYLKTTVESIYEALKSTERDVCGMYPELSSELPDKIHFIHAEELLLLFPDLTIKQRETKITARFGAVFIIGIGANLSDGKPHDGRAPDYDDWSTLNEEGFYGLNGDIVVWNPVLQSAFEISSMGIRVDKEALEKQLEIRGCSDRKNLMFHNMLLNNQLPLSIGGGIGQSRVCMYFLKKTHIGEVQSSIWPDTILHKLNEEGIQLL
ncbi:MAG TPA: aspartate--ammonia ligase [Bacteroidales bacterium]|nr:aspartate--ammonia ligase [Bacteroidales bacterium]